MPEFSERGTGMPVHPAKIINNRGPYMVKDAIWLKTHFRTARHAAKQHPPGGLPPPAAGMPGRGFVDSRGNLGAAQVLCAFGQSATRA